MDGLAKRRKRAPGVNDPDLAEKLHDLLVDAIAAVGDDDDAGLRPRPTRREALGADAQKQGGEAVPEKRERLIVERDADDVLKSALARRNSGGEDRLAVNSGFRFKDIAEVEDAAAD